MKIVNVGIVVIAQMIVAQAVSRYDEFAGTIIGLLALIIVVGGIACLLLKVMWERGYY